MKYKGQVEFGATPLKDGWLQPFIALEMSDGVEKKWFKFECDHTFPNNEMAKAFVNEVYEILAKTPHQNFFKGERPSAAP